MPAIRDARGVLTVHDMGAPPGNPSGPVERSQASAQRMADFAAERVAEAERPRRRHDAEGRSERSYQLTPEAKQRAQASSAASRARGAQRAGFVKGATKPKGEPVSTPAPAESGQPHGRDQVRAAKVGLFLDAIRATSSNGDAALRLDVKKHTVEQFISDLRRRGELPLDVDQLIRARNPGLYRRAPAPAAVAEPAHIVSADLPIEGQEAGAPATDAVDLGTTGAAPAEEVATPPGLTELPYRPTVAPELELAYVTIEGEDRCPFGGWLGTAHLSVCDRPSGHLGDHRGRLFRVGVTAGTCEPFGHLAVPA